MKRFSNNHDRVPLKSNPPDGTAAFVNTPRTAGMVKRVITLWKDTDGTQTQRDETAELTVQADTRVKALRTMSILSPRFA